MRSFVIIRQEVLQVDEDWEDSKIGPEYGNGFK